MKRTEFIAIALIIVFATIASISQTIVYWIQTPSHASYTFAHNFLEDYFYYLHIMRQGMDGAWFATSKLTPEVFPGQFVNTWLLLLGHIARIAHISLPITYTLSRIVGAGAILLLSYNMIRLVYAHSIQRVVALFFVAFGTFFLIPGSTGLEMPWLVRAWTELDPLFRLSYIPHHLWSKFFFIALLLVVHMRWSRYTSVQIMLVAILTLCMGFASPIILAIYVPLILLATLFDAIFSWKKFILDRHVLFLRGISILLSLLIAYHHRQVQYSVFPWTGSYIAWENFMRYPITLKLFIETLGPTLLFFIFAIPRFLKESSVTRLIVAWVVTGFVLLFIVGNIVPLSNSRYLAGYYFIPIAIGAVSGLYIVAKKVSIVIRIPYDRIVYSIVLCLSLYYLFGFFITWRLHASYISENAVNTQVYLPNDIRLALEYLQTQPIGVVLGRYWLSTIVPAYTSHRTVAGHMLMTLNNDQKKAQIAQFYSYTLSRNQALELLKKYNVNFIIEDRVTTISDAYMKLLPFETVYSNDTVKVYKLIIDET